MNEWTNDKWPFPPPLCQTFPFFGVVPAILNESGEELEGPSEGYLVRIMSIMFVYFLSCWVIVGCVQKIIHTVCTVQLCAKAVQIQVCNPYIIVWLLFVFVQVFKQPWPGIMRTVYGNHPRFETTYFKKFPGYYVTGDGEGNTASQTYLWISVKRYYHLYSALL